LFLVVLPAVPFPLRNGATASATFRRARNPRDETVRSMTTRLPTCISRNLNHPKSASCFCYDVVFTLPENPNAIRTRAPIPPHFLVASHVPDDLQRRRTLSKLSRRPSQSTKEDRVGSGFQIPCSQLSEISVKS